MTVYCLKQISAQESIGFFCGSMPSLELILLSSLDKSSRAFLKPQLSQQHGHANTLTSALNCGNVMHKNIEVFVYTRSGLL